MLSVGEGLVPSHLREPTRDSPTFFRSVWVNPRRFCFGPQQLCCCKQKQVFALLSDVTARPKGEAVSFLWDCFVPISAELATTVSCLSGPLTRQATFVDRSGELSTTFRRPKLYSPPRRGGACPLPFGSPQGTPLQNLNRFLFVPVGSPDPTVGWTLPARSGDLAGTRKGGMKCSGGLQT
jgi:hypothetical protein